MSETTYTKVLGVLLRMGLVSVVTFYTLKYIISYVDPTNKSKKEARKKAEAQLKRLNLSSFEQLNDYELMIAAQLVHPEEIDVSWDDIAGLDSLISELRENVILPIKCKKYFGDSKLTQPPKGVLLHGPPGCGKTLIAKATAKEADTRFINLNVSILTDKWYGESQRLAAAVFTLAVKLQPCIIFIDEIDSFLRVRSMNDHEATAMMKAQFMSYWDGLITDPNCTVIVMGATNRPSDLDQAILRRMPAVFHITLPGMEQRKKILKLVLTGEQTELTENDYDNLARSTEGFSGSDLCELCRNANVYRVRDFVRNIPTQTVPSSFSEGALLKDNHNQSFLQRMFFSNSNSNPTTSNNIESTSSSTTTLHELRSITINDLITSLNKMKESKMHCRTSVLTRPDLD